MASIAPHESFDALKERTIEALKGLFPIKGRKHELRAISFKVDDKADLYDVTAQKNAKLKDRSWTVPVQASLSLVDIASNKVIDRKTVTVANLPKITPRYSFIVRGKEYQVTNQFRLKRAIYPRNPKGILQAHFNDPTKRPFHIQFDPEKRGFTMVYGHAQAGKGTHIPLYSVMKAMGVSDDELKDSWGGHIFDAAKSHADVDKDLKKFHKAAKLPDGTDLFAGVKNTLLEHQYDPEANKLSLGHAFEKPTGGALLTTSSRLLGISRGEADPVDRDSLAFKDLFGVEDQVEERLKDKSFLRNFARKVRNNLDKSDDISRIITPSFVDDQVRGFFSSNSLSQLNDQTNPLDMMAGHMQTTPLGPGGTSLQSLTDSKHIGASHLGFLDPIHTPECYDEETEVFTSKGWKAWPKVDKSDFLACRVDGRLEFHRPERLVASRYKGLLYGVDTPRFEYLVTPNHRVYCKPYEWRSFKWRVDRADAVHGKARQFTSVHEPYNGEEISKFVLPAIDKLSNHQKSVPPMDVNDWGELLGWFLSEGNVQFSEERSHYVTVISQCRKANQENCERIEALLGRLGWSWSYQDHGYHIAGKQLATYLKQFGLSHEKFVPQEVFNLPEYARFCLVESLLWGDGRVDDKRADGSSSWQRVFTTTSPRLAEDFDRLCISLGWSTTTKVYPDHREDRYLDVYEVRILKHDYRTALPNKGHYKTVEYDGMVYCATVPGGLLLVRRNKKTCIWSGNSETVGVTLHLALGAKKKGRNLKLPVWDIKQKKTVHVGPDAMEDKIVVFHDQVTWSGGKPTPKSSKVRASVRGDVEEVAFKDAHYVLKSGKAMFAPEINLVPFVQNTQGNRMQMAAKQMAQAISLEGREAPLVQSKTEGTGTFDSLLGKFASHRSTVDGKVTQITKDYITVKGTDGKSHKHHIYNNYPLNDKKTLLTATPVVKVGDEVRRGQLLADSSFTKGGTLALGKNLRVAYISAAGYNFEDGIAISQTAAKKLSSEHLHEVQLRLDQNTTLGKKRFIAEFPSVLSKTQAEKLDDEGVIREGMEVNQGDTLIAAVKERKLTTEDQALAKLSKILARPYADVSKNWDSNFPGKVVEVVKRAKTVQVRIRTTEPAQLGDKLAGRHGNKGIIVKILPDEDMPKNKDGEGVEIMLNPLGVPSRINPSQLMELAAAKIAKKTGKPYVVDNFGGEKDYSEKVRKDLKDAGLEDTEELFDPSTGESLGKVLTGPLYTLKLKHQIEKGKLSVRGGGYPNPYTMNEAPRKGGPRSAQSMDALSMYSMLSHGARHNLREMATWRSGHTNAPERDDFWAALMAGEPLPPPKPTFAFEKFLGYLKGMGVNIERNGHKLNLSPLTDKQVEEMSAGEIADPSMIMDAKNFKADDNGIFGKSTGGLEGTNWSHFTLHEPMPNPLFEDGIKKVLGITRNQFADLVNGETEVDGKLGGPAIKAMLDKIDVDKEIKELSEKIKTANGSTLNKLYQRLRHLRAIKKLGISPSEAFMMTKVPVLPPAMRPIAVTGDGTLKMDDLNDLYSQLGMINNQFKARSKDIEDSQNNFFRQRTYDGLKSLTGLGGFVNKHPISASRRRGIMQVIEGKTYGDSGKREGAPKEGYFQSKLVSRRQDLSIRSTITPEPSLGLDEVGLPREAAMELYRPFVVQRMRDFGYAPLSAMKAIDERETHAWEALEQVVKERPIKLKRNPVLHKFGIMAFKPKLVAGKAIQIHPLVTGGYNADFDGDAMEGFVPISQEAIDEAHKMMPSNNLFHPATGKVMHAPGKEMILGLHLLTEWGKEKKIAFRTAEEAMEAATKRRIHVTDVVQVGTKKTTVGRLMVMNMLPRQMQKQEDLRDMISQPKWRIDKKHLGKLMTALGKAYPNEYGVVANRLKDLGNRYSYESGFTVSLKDLKVDKKTRDAYLKAADKQAAVIKSKIKDPLKRDAALVKLYSGVTKKLDQRLMTKADEEDNAFRVMQRSGSRGDWSQVRQIIGAPMLVQDSTGATLPTPIRKSYAEGLPMADYWTSMHGARKGMMQRALGTAEPGKYSKRLIQSTMNQLVTEEDCGTTSGVRMQLSDPEIMDRHLAKGISQGKIRLASDTILTPEVVTRLRNAKMSSVWVRSPLKCELPKGICQRCTGLTLGGKHFSLGTNLGTLSGQALGEPATQLAMNAFHQGGVAASSGGKSVDQFTRLGQLLNLPERLPGSAVLATTPGVVNRVAQDPSGGHRVTIGTTEHYIPRDPGILSTVRKGKKVKKGDPLSQGNVNPHELLDLTSHGKVQEHLTDQLYGIYRDGGPVNKRMVETVVRAMTDMGEVEDSGDSSDVIRGDTGSIRKFKSINKTLKKAGKKPIVFKPRLRGLDHLPLDVEEDWMARMNHTNLKTTVAEGALQGWSSDLHGEHPIPSYVHGAGFGKGKKDRRYLY